MFEQCLTGKLHSLGNGFLRNATIPVFNNRFPGHSISNLLKHIPDEHTRAAKSRLAMTNAGVSNNIAPEQFGFFVVTHMSTSYRASCCYYTIPWLSGEG